MSRADNYRRSFGTAYYLTVRRFWRQFPPTGSTLTAYPAKEQNR